MKDKLIYIADDEINICNIIKSFLLKEGCEVTIFNDGYLLLEAFNKKEADMLLVDIMMPKIDGFSLCSLIRRKSSVPIIFISAKDTEPDKIAGLNLGADDYLTKPFSPMELIARIKSIFRRIEIERRAHEESPVINILDMSVNINTKQAEISGRNIGLTAREFSLIYYLIRNKNKVISRNELLYKIWGFENDIETRAADDMIKRIRKKLSDVNSIFQIETVRGFGFIVQDKE
jgi:DNA-binding response OmpR family regulator